MLGLKLAALYGFWPHRLGFCGPREKLVTQILFDYLSGKKVSEKKVRKILEEFKGAYSYYKLISRCNNIEDPFDEKVIKAYWIGNELLERITPSSLKEMIIKEFSRPDFFSQELAEKKAKEVSINSKPHHSFHVLIVGSVSGRITLQGDLMDLCRVSWGQVKRISKDSAVIKYQPLSGKFQLLEAVEKEIRWEKAFPSHFKTGDWVSAHWNYLIQILSKEDLTNLKKYTQITIDSLKNYT